MGTITKRNSAALADRCSNKFNRKAALGWVLLLVLVLSYYGSVQQQGNGGGGGPDDDPYARTPFCDAVTGRCGEDPAVPSPRTEFSAKTREQYDAWWEAHAALNRSAAEFAAAATMKRRQGRSGEGRNRALILLGDSITESWIGTNLGHPESRTEGVPAVLAEAFRPRYDPLVLAIGGDQTQHLLYRLEKGQLLPEYADDEDAIFVALIGTNNLGAGELPGPTSAGVMAVADHVLSRTKGRLLLQQLLPRGDSERVARLCPPRCDSRGDPFRSFMPAVDKVNAAIRDEVAPKLAGRYGSDRLSLLDCNSAFLDAGNKSGTASGVNDKLMPDRLHPNAEGHRLLAKCILDCIGGNC